MNVAFSPPDKIIAYSFYLGRDERNVHNATTGTQVKFAVYPVAFLSCLERTISTGHVNNAGGARKDSEGYVESRIIQQDLTGKPGKAFFKLVKSSASFLFSNNAKDIINVKVIHVLYKYIIEQGTLSCQVLFPHLVR